MYVNIHVMVGSGIYIIYIYIPKPTMTCRLISIWFAILTRHSPVHDNRHYGIVAFYLFCSCLVDYSARVLLSFMSYFYPFYLPNIPPDCVGKRASAISSRTVGYRSSKSEL